MNKVLTLALALVASSAFAQTAPKVDGTIGAKEYANSAKEPKSGIVLNWSIVGDTIYFGFTAKADAWLGIGFNPTGDKKDGADMYMFAFDKGKVNAMDMTMTKPKGEPKMDDKEGCKDNILASGMSASGGNLTVEFSRKLNTGDKCDSVLEKGKSAKVLYATSDNTNTAKAHKKDARWEVDVVLK